jgi:hypothetical protein
VNPGRPEAAGDLRIMPFPSPVATFGAGSLGRRVAQAVHPVLLCDNNPALWGTVCEGVPVESVETAIKRYPDATFIVAIWHPSRTERNDRPYQPTQVLAGVDRHSILRTVRRIWQHFVATLVLGAARLE